ncbi:MAG: 23S rRNA (adenine(2503)-C(2))-methyltransferase RlmN [Oscillospiraceae bacterium]|nr:23S rRNA (adenine(2503)-C(2))-methyltransferase RlmN [Oscillospiraceae bacterium]
MCKVSLSAMTKEELKAFAEARGWPAFRAKQIFSWLHQKRAAAFAEMTNLPRAMQEELERACRIDFPAIARKQVSKDGTVKYLFRLFDENSVESVVMKYSYGYTICVSSQVGCRMGCRFCASTQGGLVRSLNAGEIAGQVYAAQKDIGERISHIVMMGMGEPFDNYDEVRKFLAIISDDEGLNIGMRNISLSTCGVIPGIERLAKEHLGLTLSVSLHAPNDTLRSGMMPINLKYPVADLMAACRAYQKETGRRVSFEYSMVQGVNDSDACAVQLSRLMKGMGAHVNLIPINPVDGSPYSSADAARIAAFQKKLALLGVNATIRRRLGADISAACGQLRKEVQTEMKKHP